MGHAPFGHEGEKVISKIRKNFGLGDFWHEKNSLRIIDDIELLEDNNKKFRNLNLTYAVRDGIISHCGEVDENGICPRKDAVDLDTISRPGQYQAFTWEGCVVKIADKIAYLGRDIEDAWRMHFIDESEIRQLINIAKKYDERVINTTVVIHNFITSICENSSPENGIRLSEEHNSLLNEIKTFNYTAIYNNSKFEVYRNYVSLIINSIFDTLIKEYDVENTPNKLARKIREYPTLIKDFLYHIDQYSAIEPHNPKVARQMKKYENKKIYGNLGTKEIYMQAIIDFISGMTDRYAIALFNELIRY